MAFDRLQVLGMHKEYSLLHRPKGDDSVIVHSTLPIKRHPDFISWNCMATWTMCGHVHQVCDMKVTLTAWVLVSLSVTRPMYQVPHRTLWQPSLRFHSRDYILCGSGLNLGSIFGVIPVTARTGKTCSNFQICFTWGNYIMYLRIMYLRYNLTFFPG